MKRRIFLVCLFYCFFRRPIYESIAAIFWKSASSVFYFVVVIFFALIQGNKVKYVCAFPIEDYLRAANKGV